MSVQFHTLLSAGDALGQICTLGEGGVVAIITGVVGPSYRPVGAVMGIDRNGVRYGNLSSGCIEQDLTLHAEEVRETRRTKKVLYGAGSPYFDIQLPCGGGLEILLVPISSQHDVLFEVLQKRQARERFSLGVCSRSGQLWTDDYKTSGWTDETFFVGFQPDLQFAIFGKGPEAYSFASLVHSIGYTNTLYAPDTETLDIAATMGCTVEQLMPQTLPESLKIDPWTAVVLFFHDHDLEPPILIEVLKSQATYIGAQGSARTAANRKEALLDAGVAPQELEKLAGPIGLIPSTRDARTLAVSVLAEILDLAR